MNRKERRKLSKKLGILNYQSKLPYSKKFNLVSENIKIGKKLHQEFLEEIRRRQNLSQEERDNENIQFLANKIKAEENISEVEALEKAQKIYKKRK